MSMEFWDKVQKDISKSLKEGLQTIREKADELTGEGKRKYKEYELNSQIHRHMAELGAAVYALKKANKKTDDSPKIAELIKKIGKLEESLDKKKTTKKEKTPTKKKAAPKKKAAVKKKAAPKKKAATDK